jgi:LPS-assembly protein
MTAGLVEQEKNYTLSLVQGDYEDSDNNWIKKEPEFKFDYGSKRFGKLPLSYNFWASYGKWKDQTKTSWHQDYNLYFTHDPISLAPSVKLDLGTGVELIHESYNNSTNNIVKFDATVMKNWSPKLDTWAGYHYTRNNVTLFSYGQKELARELNLGFSYKIDKLDSISVSQSYDVSNNYTKDLDYTWQRNMHCWQLNLTYRAMRHQYHVSVSTIHF